MCDLTLKKYVSTHASEIIEDIAKRYHVSLKQIIQFLPNYKLVPSFYFKKICDDISSWGEVLFLQHLDDIIVEIDTHCAFIKDDSGNVMLKNNFGTCIKIKSQHCHDIAFIERKFMSLDTASIVFLNAEGQAMFKIFVPYDKSFNMLPSPLAKFRQLRDQLPTFT